MPKINEFLLQIFGNDIGNIVMDYFTNIQIFDAQDVWSIVDLNVCNVFLFVHQNNFDSLFNDINHLMTCWEEKEWTNERWIPLFIVCHLFS